MGVFRADFMDDGMRGLWDSMRPFDGDFRLYGGTALALRLGHRSSSDFDFATTLPVVDRDLPERIPWLKEGIMDVKGGPGMVDAHFQVNGQREIKITFIECGGLLAMPLRPAETSESNGIQVAHPLDLAVTKLEALANRGERRDAKDVASIASAWPEICREAVRKARRNEVEIARALSLAQLEADGDEAKRLSTLAVSLFRDEPELQPQASAQRSIGR